MASSDPLPTQGDVHAGVPAELVAAGFEDPEEIGRGGFGVVYRCSQPELDRTVAVKVLTADLEPDNLERFVREQVAMGKLSGHPHIVTIFQVGTTATGRPYIVMQYHPHGSLEAKIHDNGPVGWADALHIGVKVAGALETAHRRGTLHRDVKPANILLTEYGEPQLTDFGIARIIGGFETSDGAVMGSPAYTAPEVLLGQPPDVTSDVYSLASTLFCCRHGARGVRAPQGRADGRPVSPDHQAPDAEPAGLRPAGRRMRGDRAGDVARHRRTGRRPRRLSGSSCARCSGCTACRSTTCPCRYRRRRSGTTRRGRSARRRVATRRGR